MIYIERTITIKKNQAKIKEPIVLYKGDMNIELRFSIENNPFKYKPGMDATYGQLIIKRPGENAKPIFSEPVKMSSSRVIFIVTGDMIDGLDAEGNYADELGAYDFQIQLLNEDNTSKGSLPPVYGGIDIRDPLCEEAIVNRTYANNRKAFVMPANDAVTFALRDGNDLFDEEGNYNKTEWTSGDIITDDRLNRVEEALYQINDSVPTNYADMEYVDDAIRNNNEYLEDYMDDSYTRKSDMYIYATQDYVSDYISDLEYVDQDRVLDMIDSNNDYIIGYADNRYVTEDYVDNAINNLDYIDQNRALDMIDSNNNYIIGYVDNRYVTEDYVDRAIENIEVPEVDLTGYASERYVDAAIANVELMPGPQGEPGPQGPMGPQGPAGKDADPADLTGYATEEYVNNVLGDIESLLGGI